MRKRPVLPAPAGNQPRRAAMAGRSRREALTGIAGVSALALTAGLALALRPAEAQDRVTIAGTGVSLSVPSGFKPATEFSGLFDAERTASIFVVLTPPATYEAFAEMFKDIIKTRAHFATQQIVLDEIATFDTAAGKALFANGRQSAGNVVFDKWVALYKGEQTVIVTVQSPRQTQSADRMAADRMVKEILRSVSLGAPSSLAEQIAHLPFSVDVVAPFRAVLTWGGTLLALTAGPLDNDRSGNQPKIVITFWDNALTKIDDVETTAVQMIRGDGDYPKVEIERMAPVTFGGLGGRLIHATGERSGGARHALVQYVGVGPQTRFMRLLASGNAAEMTRLDPTLQRIAASVKPKDAR